MRRSKSLLVIAAVIGGVAITAGIGVFSYRRLFRSSYASPIAASGLPVVADGVECGGPVPNWAYRCSPGSECARLCGGHDCAEYKMASDDDGFTLLRLQYVRDRGRDAVIGAIAFTNKATLFSAYAATLEKALGTPQLERSAIGGGDVQRYAHPRSEVYLYRNDFSDHSTIVVDSKCRSLVPAAKDPGR